VLRGFRLSVRMGKQYVPQASSKTCCRGGLRKRVFSIREYRWVVSARSMGRSPAKFLTLFYLGSYRYVWPSMWGPSYRFSYAITTSCAGFSLLMLYFMKLHLEGLNRKLDVEEEKRGVKHKGFRYLS
jgi:hypothetical protein